MPPLKTRAVSHQPGAGRSQAAKIAVQQTTARVREMHQAIASKPFSVLRRVPFLAGPTRLVQIAHDRIVAGVYQAIHHGSGALFDAAAILEERRVQQQPVGEAPRRLATRMDAALNGVFGDHLAATENRLAIVMTLYHEGATLALGGHPFPAVGRRLCVFVHGLACDESSWQPRPGHAEATTTVDFGQQLQADLGYTPLYLRYNSGLPISRNGGELAALLEQLITTSAPADSELVIIGHSMGGLVAMAACEQAAAAGMRWPLATRMLICLGAPQLGSALERLGHLVTSALQVSTVTQPIARIATARSQGIQDLRHGPGAARVHPAAAHIAYRFLGASLAEDVEQRFGRLLGDGLVSLGSATAPAAASDVQTATLGRLGHMALLTDARVYRQIGEWVAALEEAERAAAHARNVVQTVVTPKPRNKASTRE